MSAVVPFFFFCFRFYVLSPKRITLDLADTYCETDIVRDIVEAQGREAAATKIPRPNRIERVSLAI